MRQVLTALQAEIMKHLVAVPGQEIFANDVARATKKTRRSIIQSLNALARMGCVQQIPDSQTRTYRWKAIRTVLYEAPTGHTVVVG